MQENKEEFFKLITKTILAINAIINPSFIVLSWQNFQEDGFKKNDIQKIQEKVNEATPSGNVPHIHFNTNIDKDYIEGLIFLGLKENSCKLKVVKK